MSENMKWKTVRVWEPDGTKPKYNNDGTPNATTFSGGARTVPQAKADAGRKKKK